MKLLGKNRNGTPDGAIESLLRAYVSRPGNRECSEFDADLANAYIERNLIPASRSRYEQHLSDCAACRKNVVALSRLAETDARPVISARADKRTVGRRVFGITSWARWASWATAAAAVIVLAISLPLLSARNSSRPPQEGSQALSESQAADSTEAVTSPEKSLASNLKQPLVSSAESQKPSEKRPVDAVSANGAAPGQQPAGAGGDRVASSSKLEAKPEAKPAEQSQGAAGSQPAAEVAAGKAQQEKRADQDASSSARQQQPSKDSAVADTKANANEQDKENARAKTQVAESVAAVPPPAAPSAKAGKMKRSSAIRALRDSASAEAVRPTERKLGNKKFSLKDDTWTDKDFDPDKDLPIVTVIRDSNVYNELLAKQVGLKAYLGGFPPADRAIIVYKGTVYKLIPQQ
jgi:hypothetical protein